MPFPLESAVAIFPPHRIQAQLMPLRAKYHQKALLKYPAHLTVMFPFVPVDNLDAACATLYQLSADIDPFEITLAGYGQFPGVIYIPPSDPKKVLGVFRQFMNAFPDYPPYGGVYGDDLHPHVTIGQFDDPDAQAAAFASLPEYEPMTFRVDRLHIAYGAVEQALPWMAYDVIWLGKHTPYRYAVEANNDY